MTGPAPADGPVDLPAALAAVAPGDLSASVAQPSPSPTAPVGEFEDFEVSPGLLGFLPPFLIALACVGLFLSLTRQLRKVGVRQARLDAEEAARAAREAGDGPAGEPDAPGGAEAADDRTDRPGPR